MHDSDWPEDFRRSVAFHGHVCGGLVLGYRAVKAAMHALGCSRADDEELVAVVETDSCAVDAVQLLAGCTFGKGNLVFRDYGKMALSLWSRKSGKGVRVSRRESIKGRSVEEMLNAPVDELFCVAPAQGPIPEQARIRDSEPCALCGEPTMVTRLEVTPKGRACIPCAARLAT